MSRGVAISDRDQQLNLSGHCDSQPALFPGLSSGRGGARGMELQGEPLPQASDTSCLFFPRWQVRSG